MPRICFFLLVPCLLIFASFVFFKSDNVKKNNTKIIFVSNDAMASLIQSISMNKILVETIGDIDANFHKYTIHTNEILRIKNEGILFFSSKEDEFALYSIAKNHNIDYFEIISDNRFLLKIYDNYYNKIYESFDEFLKNKNSINSHIWLSINTSLFFLESVLYELVRRYPEYESFFYNNYISSQARLKEVFNEMIERSKKCNKTKIFATHDALFYLVIDEKINYVGHISDHNTHGFIPATVEILLSESKYGKVCLFFDHIENTRIIKKLKNKNIKTDTINFDGKGIKYKQGINEYINFFRKNNDTILNCIC